MDNRRNGVLWFLVEVTFTEDDKIHIEHVILRLYDIHYGLSYLYENPELLENGRIFAVIRENGDTRFYRKDEREKTGIGYFGFRESNLETDYDNVEELFPYMDDYVPFGEYGKVYYEYE